MSKYIVQLEEDAKMDIADSFDWYSKISAKVADHFLLQIKDVISYLEQDPFLFQEGYKDYRQVPLKKYPYVLLFKIEKRSVKIYRVFPTKKDPRKKFGP